MIPPRAALLAACSLAVGSLGGCAAGETPAATEPDAGAAATPDAAQPPPRCAGVACDSASGLVCSEDDGLCHCGAASGPVCGATDTCLPDQGRCEPPVLPVCGWGARWSPGMVVFRDATEDWGLGALGVEGTRLAVLDADGDGWPDLFVRRGGNAPDDFNPGGARQSWLLRNTGNRGFEDLTERSGIRAPRGEQAPGIGRPGEVVAFADVDNDGDLDAYTGMSTGVRSALAQETSELLLNDGSGRFTLGPASGAIRREGQPDAVAGASFTDFDRDGFVDLWIAEHSYVPDDSSALVFLQDHLFRGDGTGGFTDVTDLVGLTTRPWVDLDDLDRGLSHSRAWSSAACDLDGDGTPELLAASYGRAPNHLFQGRRDAGGEVRYENRSVASGYAFDEVQEWRDNEFAKCWCQSNPTAEGCEGVGRPRITCSQPNWSHAFDRRPYRLGGNSGTTVCADVNNDGHLDLFTTEITHWWAGSGADRSELLVNTGEPDVRFVRPGNGTNGLARPQPTGAWDFGDMTAAIFDFDLDTWPDVYVGASDYAGNHGLLFHQVERGRFEPVRVEEGIDHHRSHGLAVADLDRDGDLDLVVGHSRARCDATLPDDCYATSAVRIFENLSPEGKNWLQLELQGGPGVNRAAIGARVTVTTQGVTQTQEVGGGHGHYGVQHELVLTFGLGESCDAEVTVRWPDAALTVERHHLVAGHRFRLVQGARPVVRE